MGASSKVGKTKGGKANHLASATGDISSIPTKAETMQPTIIPAKIGRSRKMPFPSKETRIVVTREDMDTMRAVFCGITCSVPAMPIAIFMPVGAKISPITAITEPVTIGGRRLIIKPMPRTLMMKLSTM